MAVQKMRIKLKAYDHNLVDQSAARIIETVKKSGAKKLLQYFVQFTNIKMLVNNLK